MPVSFAINLISKQNEKLIGCLLDILVITPIGLLSECFIAILTDQLFVPLTIQYFVPLSIYLTVKILI